MRLPKLIPELISAFTYPCQPPPPPALGQSESSSPPATPASVTLTRADGTVTASWPTVSGATKYHVTYSTDNGGSWHAPVSNHTNITANSLTFNADNAKSYIVGVRAGNDNDQWSGWRNSPSAGPYTPPDPTPTPDANPHAGAQSARPGGLSYGDAHRRRAGGQLAGRQRGDALPPSPTR